MSQTAKVALVLALVTIMLGLPSLRYPFGGVDQGTFSYVARAMLEDGKSYWDFWNTTAPGVFFIYAFAFKIFGQTMIAVRAFDLLYSLATAMVIYCVALRFCRRWTAFAAGALWSFSYFGLNDYWELANCDAFLTLPIACSALCVIIFLERGSRPWLLAGGAVAALAFFVKPTSALFALGLVVVSFGGVLFNGKKERVLLSASGLSIYLAGFAVTALACLLCLVGKKHFPAFCDYVTVTLSSYSKISGRPPGPFSRFEATWSFIASRYAFLALPAIAGCYFALFDDMPANRKPWRAVLFIWLITSLASVWAQDKFFIYHWLPFLAPAALFAAYGMETLLCEVSPFLSKSRPPPKWRALLLGVFLLLLLVNLRLLSKYTADLKYALGVMGRGEYEERFSESWRVGFSYPADRAVADYIARRTSPSQKVYIWGNEALVYFLSGRRCPTRFVLNWPLINARMPRGKLRSELMEDLVSSPPAYFLVVRGDQGHANTRISSDRALPSFPELLGYLNANYVRETTIEDFDIWRRKAVDPVGKGGG